MLKCLDQAIINIINHLTTLLSRYILSCKSLTYRIAVGQQQGRKVFTLQTLPDCGSGNPLVNTVGEVAGFSLHAGVAARANERTKLERLCRYVTRPPVSTRRLSMTRNGRVRYELNQK